MPILGKSVIGYVWGYVEDKYHALSIGFCFSLVVLDFGWLGLCLVGAGATADHAGH